MYYLDCFKNHTVHKGYLAVHAVRARIKQNNI